MDNRYRFGTFGSQAHSSQQAGSQYSAPSTSNHGAPNHGAPNHGAPNHGAPNHGAPNQHQGDFSFDSPLSPPFGHDQYAFQQHHAFQSGYDPRQQYTYVPDPLAFDPPEQSQGYPPGPVPPSAYSNGYAAQSLPQARGPTSARNQRHGSGGYDDQRAPRTQQFAPTPTSSHPPGYAPRFQKSSAGPQRTSATGAAYSGAGKIAPPDGLIPAVFGTQITPAEGLALWEQLGADDQRRLLEFFRSSGNANFSAMNVDVEGLETRSPSSKTNAARKAADKGKGADRQGGAGTNGGRYKTPYVEDADDEDDEDTMRSNGGYASYSEPQGRPSQRPYTQIPAYQSNNNNMGAIVMNAIHHVGKRFDERLDKLETMVAGGARTKNAKQSTKSSKQHESRRAGHSDDDGAEAGADSRAENDRLLKEEAKEQARLDKPHLVRLKAAVRHYLDVKLLKLKSAEQLPEKSRTLTAQEVKDYEARTTPYFTIDNFRIDFVRGWKRFSFNVEAEAFFIDKFLEAIAGGAYMDPPIPERFLTPGWISKALESHITYLRGVYRDLTAPKTAAHLKKLENRRLRKRTAARKNTTLKVRKRVIDRHELDKHKQLFAKLKPCHMSGDEAQIDANDNDRQTHPRVFYIVDAFWSSKKFKGMVRTLDSWNVEDWRQTVGEVLPGGNAPRQRIALAKPRVVNSKAPKGLWKNCYNDKWLATLKPHVRRKLRIINEDYDFRLPAYRKPKNLTGEGDFAESDDEDDEGDEDGEGSSSEAETETESETETETGTETEDEDMSDD